MSDTITTHIKLCIPRINSDIQYQFILNKLNEFKLGKIISMKEIPLKNETMFKKIIIKMAYDKENPRSREFETMLHTVGSVKLVYNMPWYWKISKYV